MRIISSGYNQLANCQCPRNIRVAGREYLVPQSAISLSQQGRTGKFFYRIKGREIKVDDGSVIDEIKQEPKEYHIRIYDTGSDDCSICMDAIKNVVFAPCGHYCCCRECATQIKYSNKAKCPMCRSHISEIVNKEDVK